MIEGIVLGFITWLSMILSWWHLPPAIKRTTLRHPVLLDMAATGLAFFFLSSISKSIIAVIGSIIAGLLVNFTIMAARNYHD